MPHWREPAMGGLIRWRRVTVLAAVGGLAAAIWLLLLSAVFGATP